MVPYFPEGWFTTVRGDLVTIVRVGTLNVLSVSFNGFTLFMWRSSSNFLLYMFGIVAIVLGWIQLICPWHSLVCLVSPDDSQLPFMLFCWSSIQTCQCFFFDSPIYPLPMHEQSSWYTPWTVWINDTLFAFV